MDRNIVLFFLLFISLAGCISYSHQAPIQKIIKKDNCNNIYGIFKFNPEFFYILNIKDLNRSITGNYSIDEKYMEIKNKNNQLLFIIHSQNSITQAGISKSRYTCKEGVLLVTLPLKSNSNGGGAVYEWNRKMHLYSVSENEIQAKINSSTLGMFSLIPIFSGKSNTLQTLKRITPGVSRVQTP